MEQLRFDTGAAETPPESALVYPKTLTQTRRFDGRLLLAGRGKQECPDVMFVATSVFEDETREALETVAFRQSQVRIPPAYLKGPHGRMLKDAVNRVGLDINASCYYTALVKHLLPKNERMRPHKEALQQGWELLKWEIERVKPKVIVTLGKPPFDFLSGLKLSASDAEGGWFHCADFPQIPLYPLYDLFKVVSKPHLLDALHLDLTEIKRMVDSINGKPWSRVELRYETINTAEELRALMGRLEERNAIILSVDCEWHGSTHIDGKLRSIQLAWAPGEAAYVRFMDDALNYVFDVDYKSAGRIMSSWCDRPEVKYVGHHIAADFPWMSHVLGLEVYEKSILDTEFAVQTINEHRSLSLERIGMAYTDLGRYDLPLVLWKKENKAKCEEGYGLIPDEILIPYALKDVDVPIRAYQQIIRELGQQDLLGYYCKIFHPFVTDVFTEFALTGLPMDIAQMDELRRVFNYAEEHLNVFFRQDIEAEAEKLFLHHAFSQRTTDIGDVFAMHNKISALISERRYDEARGVVREEMSAASGYEKALTLLEHWIEAPSFNIRSTDMMRRWLFEVKGYTPIKSTSNKAKGLPSMSWDRVANYPEEVRRDYKPSTDAQSIQILAQTHDDATLHKLLELNAVGNLKKAFLKEPTFDEETGEMLRENGLHFWLASDGRIHGQMSTTETGRPRSWKPNILNWPSYVNDKVNNGVKDCFLRLKKLGKLDPSFFAYIAQESDGVTVAAKPIPSIRSCVRAPEGWCLVESDFQTAEMRGLAFISGDENLIRLICDPDEDFGVTKDGKKVRLKFTASTGILPVHSDPELLLSFVGKDKRRVKVSEADLVRSPDGKLEHPKADLHWSIVEMAWGRPREVMHEKKDRGAGKVANFSSAYGASANTLERKIESDTGSKPEAGSGDKLLDALDRRQPVASAFLRNVETAPSDPGFLRAASGRIRHFVRYDIRHGVSRRMEDSMLSSQGREARNFFMQESVAATAARAAVNLLRYYRQNRLEAHIMVVLYDSVVTLLKKEYRFGVADLHQRFMCDENSWDYHGRKLVYPIDTDLCMAWSTKPSDEEKKWLYNKS